MRIRKTLIMAAVLLTGQSLFSQTNFEKGYYINNRGEAKHGFIKNVDWKNNPEQITWKASRDASPGVISIDDMQSFVIKDKCKYVRETIKIAMGGFKLNQLDYNANPDRKEMTVMLKTILEGKASLYAYFNESTERFFYSTDNGPVRLLKYRRYYKEEGDTKRIMETKTYLGQLRVELQCDGMASMGDADYRLKDIRNIFENYNRCKGVDVNSFDEEKGYDVRFTVKSGLGLASGQMWKGGSNYSKIQFDNNALLRLGGMLEFVLPFNNDKWSLAIETMISRYEDVGETYQRDASIDYLSMEFAAGVNHYMFLREDMQVFLNSFIIMDYGPRSVINLYYRTNVQRGVDLKTGINFSFGGGFQYKKYSIELEYQTVRELSTGVAYWHNPYHNMSLNLGYRF